MLNPEDRAALREFVGRSPEGTPYLRRVQILLLADEGLPADSIALKVDLPVARVRQMLRVYDRQGLAAFPEELFSMPAPFTADEHIAEAGRSIMAGLLELISSYEESLRERCDESSVHESRKGMRQLRTACRLFAPFFEDGLLESYRRRFRKSMRRLGRSRDLFVFNQKLTSYMSESLATGLINPQQHQELAALLAHFEVGLANANTDVRDYMAKGKYRDLMDEFGQFVHSPGERLASGQMPQARSPEPAKVRLLVPVHLYSKLAAVRAYDSVIAVATLPQLHGLRIANKELRYTLEFYQPILGPAAKEIIEEVKKLHDHLGDINDARVALLMLEKIVDRELASGAGMYHAVQEGELRWLVDGLPPVWKGVNEQGWRQKLAAAVGVL